MLNRVLRYKPDGFEHEADPRQAEKRLEGFNLDSNCDRAATPGLKPLIEQLAKDEQLPTDGHIEFRGFAARANYLLADRIDLQFSTKEICRFVSSPTDTSMDALKWIG